MSAFHRITSRRDRMWARKPRTKRTQWTSCFNNFLSYSVTKQNTKVSYSSHILGLSSSLSQTTSTIIMAERRLKGINCWEHCQSYLIKFINKNLCIKRQSARGTIPCERKWNKVGYAYYNYILTQTKTFLRNEMTCCTTKLSNFLYETGF